MPKTELLKPISVVRFNALAGYCREPASSIILDEVGWFQAYEESLLVVIARDRTDSEFSGVLLAKDLKERYRWVAMTEFFDTKDSAFDAASTEVVEVFQKLAKERVQGDEKGLPVDFFTPVKDASKLHPSFRDLTTLEGYSPALELIRPMMRWHDDADGNFIEQFQTTGFDTRLWELYLFAALVEAGYAIDRAEAIPDFSVKGVLGSFCVEATTVNPSRDGEGNLVAPPTIDSPEQFRDFQREYMPIRFAGPLTAKLAKQYWERANVKGKPLAFAIQDFHAPMSMTITRGSLPIYLYGFVHDWHRQDDGKLVITPRKVDIHRWKQKEIRSGFFNLEGSENVSAVLANPSATIAKFNRIGLSAGFGSKRVRMVRRGTVADPDSNASVPKLFEVDVNAPDFRESWMEGMDVYHNPKALHPLNPAMLPGAAHHFLRADGQVASTSPRWQPLASHTQISVRE